MKEAQWQNQIKDLSRWKSFLYSKPEGETRTLRAMNHGVNRPKTIAPFTRDPRDLPHTSAKEKAEQHALELCKEWMDKPLSLPSCSLVFWLFCGPLSLKSKKTR